MLAKRTVATRNQLEMSDNVRREQKAKNLVILIIVSFITSARARYQKALIEV